MTEVASSVSEPLRAGDMVEIRSADEIVATLGESGRLEGMPFMPEMLKFCGTRVRVQSRAHKTCETALSSGFRRLERTMHLEELRCDGSAHGGCQASCLLFWKTEWLKPVGPASEGYPRSGEGSQGDERARAVLEPTTETQESTLDRVVYSCQATELRGASAELRWWDVRQYVEDLSSGNVGVARLSRGLAVLVLNKFQAANRRFMPRLTLINHGIRYPFVAGKLTGQTPSENLDLQPGETVRIKSKEEIERTLDRNNKNHGLLFDNIMSKYCGRTAKVQARVTKIVDERTGEMRHMKNECVVLEGVVCTGDYMQLCPRRIYAYWRGIWLERV
jgi:hypothetical protein